MVLLCWLLDGLCIVFIGGLMSDQGVIGGDFYVVLLVGGVVIVLILGIKVILVWFVWIGVDYLLVVQICNGCSEVVLYVIDVIYVIVQVLLFIVDVSFGDGSVVMGLLLLVDYVMVVYVQSFYVQVLEVYVGVFGVIVLLLVIVINVVLKFVWGQVELIGWDNEGCYVQGWLFYLVNYDKYCSYLMIVMVYGGLVSVVLLCWLLVGFGGVLFLLLGYFVFMFNLCGSYGQGEDYVQVNCKDFGYGDLCDIFVGVDIIEKKLLVDDYCFGFIGWSYGGFMSMFVLIQIQCFCVVVVGVGIVNWQSYYGQNLIDQWMILFFGVLVYDDLVVYVKSLVINFIKQVKMLMLIVVGDCDVECFVLQLFEMWYVLCV